MKLPSKNLVTRVKWIVATIGWSGAFTFWFQIIVVLYASVGDISQLALHYFHFLWLIIVCSFFSASFTPPVSVRSWELENGAPKTKQKSENEDFCEKCNYRKPPRWHHCRQCDRCVHRMDHHCPILQLCVHNTNHKYFLLFLLWPFQLAIFTLYNGYIDLWRMIVSIFTFEDLSLVDQLKGAGVSNALMVGVATVYLLKDQLPNLLRNQTLIEESRETTHYNLGSWRENVKSIMGPSRIAWLPVPARVLKMKEKNR